MTKKYVEKKDNVKETSNQDKRLYAMARHLYGKFNPPDTLHSAAEKGDFYLTVYILSKGADLNAPDKHGWTPLHHAVYSGNVDIVRFLINQGANYNITDNEGTPVYYAFQYGHVRIVKYFVEEKGYGTN